MVRTIEIERGSQIELTLPVLIARLDLNAIKDSETREYCLDRAGRISPYFSTIDSYLSTAQVIDLVINTEIASFVAANSRDFKRSYIQGFIDREKIMPDETDSRGRKKFGFEKAFAFLVFHREMVIGQLRDRTNAHEIAYSSLEEKFGKKHKLLSFLNTEIKNNDKRKLLGTNRKFTPETERIKLPTSNETAELLKKTTKKELLALREEIVPFKKQAEIVSFQKVTLSSTVIGNIILVAKMIGFTRIQNLTEKLRYGARIILRKDYEYDASNDSYKTLANSIEILLREMSDEDGNAKNLFELKEKASSALRDRLGQKILV